LDAAEHTEVVHRPSRNDLKRQHVSTSAENARLTDSQPKH
jgi:hypothetical protein